MLPIEKVEVNPQASNADPKTLRVFIVRDAARADVKSDGCVSGRPARTDPLDAISVRGACVVLSGTGMEMRCSSAAVRISAPSGPARAGKSGAALHPGARACAYLQGKAGAYSGGEGRITLKDNQAGKLQLLRNGCDPVSTRLEEEADALSLQVMSALLDAAPYRETFFSERGSMYWNIDLLAVATDACAERIAGARCGQHAEACIRPSSRPDLPTPPQKIEAAARRFVCDVLDQKQGPSSIRVPQARIRRSYSGCGGLPKR